MPPVLLGNKVHPPVVAGHIIARPQLFTRLDLGLNAKLMLVSSPAGTGKSTLLAAWLQQQNSPAAWLSLDKGDDTLGQFLLYLVGALQTLGLGLGEGLSELLRPPNTLNVEPLLIGLSNEFARLGGKVILVLDDYHFLSDPRIHGAVEFLLDHLPPQVCLVISTRTDPPLHLARLRLHGQLLEVRGSDLRFGLAETTEFLNVSQGLGLSPTAVASLEAQTEGWIVALQLAALSLAARPDKEAFVRAFVGSHRFLVDYLVDEVLSRLSAATRTFLQRTAILERFDRSLCEVVTGQSTDPDLLGQLEAANLFLIPLDDERRWYRFHHLFGEFLRHRLRADEPEVVPELHRRASAWFAEVGSTDDAIRHAFLAGDDHLAARLADDAAPTLAQHWNSEQFARYFQRIPAGLLPFYPRLCLYYCWFLVTTGQLGTFKTALPLLEESKAHSPEPQVIDAAVVGLQAYERFHRLDLAGAARLCEQQTVLLGNGVQVGVSQEAHLVRIGGTNLRASVALYGDPRQAAELYAESLGLSQQLGGSIGTANGTIGLARSNHQLGQLQGAGDVLRRGLSRLESAGSDRASGSGNIGELHVRLGRLSYEWNQLAEAEACVQRARTCNELYGSPVVRALELELSVRLFLARGETEAASGALYRLNLSSATVHHDDQLVRRTFEVMAMRSRLALAAQLSRSDLHRSEELLTEVSDWLGARQPHRTVSSGSSLGADLQVRWLLARNDPAGAVPLLEGLIGAAQAEHRGNDLIGFLLLQALALHGLSLQGLDREDAAMRSLGLALDLAEPGRYCRSFLDLGDGMRALLERRAQRRSTPYLAALLDAFQEHGGHAPVSERPGRAAAVQQGTGVPAAEGSERGAFNARELAVLRALEAGATHKQIAKELQISPNTVRWYMKSLYIKLRANNKTEALNHARATGLV